jgi:hypothetical protein
MSGNTFLAELKRRNVIHMAGLYLASAWLVAHCRCGTERNRLRQSAHRLPDTGHSPESGWGR